MFHPCHYIIVKTQKIKVSEFEMYRRGVQTFHRDHDCFWILAAHLDMNLLAVGHDSGPWGDCFQVRKRKICFCCL